MQPQAASFPGPTFIAQAHGSSTQTSLLHQNSCLLPLCSAEALAEGKQGPSCCGPAHPGGPCAEQAMEAAGFVRQGQLPPPDDLAPQRTLKHSDSQTCPQTQGQKHRVGGSLAPCPRVHLSTQGTARADRTSSSSHHTEGHLASENSGHMPLSLGRPFRWQPSPAEVFVSSGDRSKTAELGRDRTVW